MQWETEILLSIIDVDKAIYKERSSRLYKECINLKKFIKIKPIRFEYCEVFLLMLILRNCFWSLSKI